MGIICALFIVSGVPNTQSRFHEGDRNNYSFCNRNSPIMYPEKPKQYPTFALLGRLLETACMRTVFRVWLKLDTLCADYSCWPNRNHALESHTTGVLAESFSDRPKHRRCVWSELDLICWSRHHGCWNSVVLPMGKAQWAILSSHWPPTLDVFKPTVIYTGFTFCLQATPFTI